MKMGNMMYPSLADMEKSSTVSCKNTRENNENGLMGGQRGSKETCFPSKLRIKIEATKRVLEQKTFQVIF